MRKTLQSKAIPTIRTSRSKQPAPVVMLELDITTRDAEGRTPLHLAAWYGYATIVQRMLAQQADINARDEHDRTPGHWAAFKGYLDVIKLLVNSGADINARDKQGRTWLTMAIIGEQSTAIAYLRGHDGVV